MDIAIQKEGRYTVWVKLAAVVNGKGGEFETSVGGQAGVWRPCFDVTSTEHQGPGQDISFWDTIGSSEWGEGNVFPLTKFVPWAAYIQAPDGQSVTLEQSELVARLQEQSSENPRQIDLELAIASMHSRQEVKFKV